MKKTLVSLAAAAALTTGAMAADKGIDIVTTGQAVVYYETHQAKSSALSNDATVGSKTKSKYFDKRSSAANVGIQLNLGADLGNNFTFGSQLSYLGTAGLEKNLVSGTKEGVTSQWNTTTEIALTKIFVAKKLGNTTVKLGRQELPKSLSPLAFSEGWNVFKNTFDAVLVVNSDIPDTTLVGAYVSKGNGTFQPTNSFTQMENLGANTALGRLYAENGAYMLTAQNKSIPMTAVTASYYHLAGLGNNNQGFWATNDTIGSADAIWLDVTVAGKDMPLGLKIAGQYGNISTSLNSATNDALKARDTKKDTTAYGFKVAMAPMDALSLQVAYSSVNNGAVSVQNAGTGVKTSLYTQMVYNQAAIARNANTYAVKGAYNMGDAGKVILAYGSSKTMKKENNAEKKGKYNELDLIYKVKAGGIQYFAALMYITAKDGMTIIPGGDLNRPVADDKGKSKDTKLRFWARYAF